MLQSGTTSRDLYYLPSDTVLAIFVDKDLNKGLLDQAGVQVAVLPSPLSDLTTDLHHKRH